MGEEPDEREDMRMCISFTSGYVYGWVCTNIPSLFRDKERATWGKKQKNTKRGGSNRRGCLHVACTPTHLLLCIPQTTTRASMKVNMKPTRQEAPTADNTAEENNEPDNRQKNARCHLAAPTTNLHPCSTFGHIHLSDLTLTSRGKPQTYQPIHQGQSAMLYYHHRYTSDGSRDRNNKRRPPELLQIQTRDGPQERTGQAAG